MIHSEERKFNLNIILKWWGYRNDRYSPCVDPDEIAGPLSEPVDGNVCGVEILQARPPAAMQVVDVVFLTELLDASPVRVGRGEPFAVTGTNVNVDRTEVVVLLVARSSTVGDFHVQLNGVHSEDHVTDVRQHVGCGHDAGKRRELLQLVKLCSPLSLVWQVDIRSEPKIKKSQISWCRFKNCRVNVAKVTIKLHQILNCGWC